MGAAVGVPGGGVEPERAARHNEQEGKDGPNTAIIVGVACAVLILLLAVFLGLTCPGVSPAAIICLWLEVFSPLWRFARGVKSFERAHRPPDIGHRLDVARNWFPCNHELYHRAAPLGLRNIPLRDQRPNPIATAHAHKDDRISPADTSARSYGRAQNSRSVITPLAPRCTPSRFVRDAVTDRRYDGTVSRARRSLPRRPLRVVKRPDIPRPLGARPLPPHHYRQELQIKPKFAPA